MYGLNSVGGGNLHGTFDLGQRSYKTYKNFIDVVYKQDLDFITKGLIFHAKLSYNTESGTLTNIQKYDAANFGEQNVIGYYKAYDYSSPNATGGYNLLTSQRWPATFQGTNPLATYDNVMQGGYQKKLFYEFGFDYAKNIKDHHITVMALMNRIEDSGLKSNSSASIQFPIHEESWVSRITYNWKERYMGELNGAYTGSQKFAPGKRFGFFPSYAVAWRISEEPFVKNLIGTTIITNLKIRNSSGVIGYDQSAPAYTYVQIYNNKGGGVSFGDISKYTYGPLYGEGSAANEDATWETAHKKNLGFDIGIINKLTITLDLFTERREGILMTVATPGWFGIGEPTGNIGETKNQGYEIDFTWNDKIGKAINYWIKGNYSFSDNRIVYRNDPANRADYLKYAGKPINVQNKLINNGYYNSLDDIFNGATANNVANQGKLVPGDLMYADFNADGKVQDTEDMVPMKELLYPLSTYGFSGGLKYKGFEMTVVFYGVGHTSQEVDGNILWDLNQGNNGTYSTTPEVNQAWTVAYATTATKPVLHSDYRSYSMCNGTSYSFQDARYLRLRNLEINYSFKSRFMKELGLSKFQIYANGTNLFTFTKYNKNIDPEQDGTGVYPIVKSYTTGLRLSF
jgi:TonB-linked SusC/RagA family outer membrane protein